MTSAGARRPAAAGWREVAADVLVRRYAPFNLNVGLVLGHGEALVIDTRASTSQGHELRADVAAVGAGRIRVVDTHHHYDHAFGNAAFGGGASGDVACAGAASPGAEIWGHERCAARLGEDGARVLDSLATAMPELARELRDTEIVAPDRTFLDRQTLDVGGRLVELRHEGRGHTDNDVAVIVPDAGVVFGGDLVEEGAPPSFEDAYPLDWPGTLGRLLDHVSGSVVPGHGDVVDRAFVEAQLADLSGLASIARRVCLEGGSPDDALPLAPFPTPVARIALRRAFAQLAGEL